MTCGCCGNRLGTTIHQDMARSCQGCKRWEEQHQATRRMIVNVSREEPEGSIGLGQFVPRMGGECYLGSQRR